MRNQLYYRTYITGTARGDDVYECPSCGNAKFATEAAYCHICGGPLPAGLYMEYRPGYIEGSSTEPLALSRSAAGTAQN